MAEPAPPSGPAPELVEAGFALEVADARFLHHGLNLADLAHTVVLWEQGVIPREAARRLLALLLEVHAVPHDDFPYDPAYGETYNCRERFFAARLGNDAGWLHAGRPRREAARVALRICLRALTAELVHATAAFAAAVADVAEAHVDTVMPDQTYLQQAQPSTFGHYVLAFAYPALRDARRLLEGDAWMNKSPAGAGCVNGSRLLLDRGRTAALLGFDGVIEHTRDAMWQTDGVVDLMAVTTDLVNNLSKLAEDLEIWDSQEFDFVDLAAPYTRASVLMPQKRNPYALAIVRGASGILMGRLAGFLAVVKTPSARSDNLIFAYGEVPRALELATRVTRLTAGATASLRVNAERMWQALLAGFSQATDLAEHVMVEASIDYRSAYLVVGRAVRQAAERGLRGVDISAELLDDAARAVIGRPLGLDGEALGAVLDPRAIVASRTQPGGAAPATVLAMARACRAEAEAVRADASRRLERYAAAEEGLVTSARERALP